MNIVEAIKNDDYDRTKQILEEDKFAFYNSAIKEPYDLLLYIINNCSIDFIYLCLRHRGKILINNDHLFALLKRKTDDVSIVNVLIEAGKKNKKNKLDLEQALQVYLNEKKLDIHIISSLLEKGAPAYIHDPSKKIEGYSGHNVVFIALIKLRYDDWLLSQMIGKGAIRTDELFHLFKVFPSILTSSFGEIIDFGIKHNIININAVDENGFSILHHCVINNLSDCIKLLIDNDVDIKTVPNILNAVIKINTLEYVQKLVEKGANINNTVPCSPLWEALTSETVNKDIISFLVKRGANVNYIKPDPLVKISLLTLLCSKFSDPDMIELFIIHGAKTRIPSETENCLITLLKEHSYVPLESVQMIVDEGVDLKAVDSDGWTALMYTGYIYKDIEIAKYLVENGADPNFLVRGEFYAAKLKGSIGNLKTLIYLYSVSNEHIKIIMNNEIFKYILSTENLDALHYVVELDAIEPENPYYEDMERLNNRDVLSVLMSRKEYMNDRITSAVGMFDEAEKNKILEVAAKTEYLIENVIAASFLLTVKEKEMVLKQGKKAQLQVNRLIGTTLAFTVIAKLAEKSTVN